MTRATELAGLIKHEVTVEREGADKPALIAEWLSMQRVAEAT